MFSTLVKAKVLLFCTSTMLMIYVLKLREKENVLHFSERKGFAVLY